MSTKKAAVKLPRPADVSASCGPRIKDPTRGNCRPSAWTRQYNPQEWQVPRRTSRPERRPGTFTLPLANRFDRLPEPEPASRLHLGTEEEHSVPRRQSHRRKKPRQPWARLRGPYPTEAEHAGQVRIQLHGDSYFLPDKVAGRAVTFLLDSGCTTNLLSHCVFDALPPKDKARIEPYTGEHSTLADGSCIPFYSIIELTGRVRDQTIWETFIVSQLEEDAILGMPFLQRHRCHIDFSKSAMLMAGRELACVNKFDRPLVGGVQVVRNCMIPALPGYHSLQGE